MRKAIKLNTDPKMESKYQFNKHFDKTFDAIYDQPRPLWADCVHEFSLERHLPAKCCLTKAKSLSSAVVLL